MSDSNITEHSLTEDQNNAVEKLVKFVNSKRRHILFLGYAGTGKTTTLKTFIEKTGYNQSEICFAAFTNKATCILRDIIGGNFSFTTIHKLLQLEPNNVNYDDLQTDSNSSSNKVEKSTDTEPKIKKDKAGRDVYEGLDFIFKPDDVDWTKYKVIIFDEVSTISKELVQYINICHRKHDYSQKIIWVGDFWQLPPIGEDNSVIFKASSDLKWPVMKLTHVVRAKNNDLLKIYAGLISRISYVQKFKPSKMYEFLNNYPGNLLQHAKFIGDYDTFITKFANDNEDSVVISYSNSNVNKVNFRVKSYLCEQQKEIFDQTEKGFSMFPTFSVGDRVMVKRPAETGRPIAIDDYYKVEPCGGDWIYNGEIFIVEECTNELVHTTLNILAFNPSLFNAQKLKLRAVGSGKLYYIFHVDPKQFYKAKSKTKSMVKFEIYCETLNKHLQFFPQVVPGWSCTLYKLQGTTVRNAYINLKSIYSCLEKTNPQAVFKAVYTATTRAQDNVYYYW